MGRCLWPLPISSLMTPGHVWVHVFYLDILESIHGVRFMGVETVEEIERCLKWNNMSMEDWVQVQESDDILWWVITLYKEKKLGMKRIMESDSWELKQFIWQRNSLRLRKGVFYWKMNQHCKDRNSPHLMLPKQYRLQAMKGCHNDIGYLGLKRMLVLLWD